jgi:uncharacterized protein (DUF342 family)
MEKERLRPLFLKPILPGEFPLIRVRDWFMGAGYCMIDFAELKTRVRSHLESDRMLQYVEVERETLEAAVLEASSLLELPTGQIEYEILQRGAVALLGKKAKRWKIRAYARFASLDKTEKADEEDGDEFEPDAAPEPESTANGDVFVRFFNDDVLVKVIPPKSGGRHVTEADVGDALERRRILGYNKEIVQDIVREEAGVYVRAAGFQHNVANDSFARIEIGNNEMKAFVMVTPPGLGGNDISYETLTTLLRANGVVFGIDEKFLEAFADRPSYGERVCVAEGTPAIDGADASIEYFFETDPSKLHINETISGSVNFKELNIIQNVMAGDKLAVKRPPGNPRQGQTVTGKLLSAGTGKDVSLPVGKNVNVEKDGATLTAAINGQVSLKGGKVEVEAVYTVENSVGVKTGNVLFLGSVIVKGNVEEGYSVKATGNIEVNGMVDKGELDAEEKIIVRQGIIGKQDVLIRAGGTIVAKFISNATIKSGDSVMASEGITNSVVFAQRSVICRGKRAAIIGGSISAVEEIQAKVLGATSGGTQTVCKVGYDPEIDEKIERNTKQVESITKELEDLERNIATLENLKKRKNSLPEDKEAYFNELTETRTKLNAERDNINTEIQTMRQYLAGLKTQGRISASVKCYPGTIIHIRDISQTIRYECSSVTFSLVDGLITAGKFEAGIPGKGAK